MASTTRSTSSARPSTVTKIGTASVVPSTASADLHAATLWRRRSIRWVSPVVEMATPTLARCDSLMTCTVPHHESCGQTDRPVHGPDSDDHQADTDHEQPPQED